VYEVAIVVLQGRFAFDVDAATGGDVREPFEPPYPGLEVFAAHTRSPRHVGHRETAGAVEPYGVEFVEPVGGPGSAQTLESRIEPDIRHPVFR
jgi:hypothetical protein